MKLENTTPVNAEIEKILNGIKFNDFDFRLIYFEKYRDLREINSDVFKNKNWFQIELKIKLNTGDIAKYDFNCHKKEVLK